MIIPYIDNNYFLPFPFIPSNCEKPPTIYSILESIVNYGKDNKTKIKDLAKIGRSTIFNFNYPLTSNINKEDFECMILNHFLMRRIGFDTVTAFQIQLNVKLNEIMPLYNKMFNCIDNWDLFNDGEKVKRYGNDNRTIENTSESENNVENESNTETEQISDRRNSELPQNQLSLLRDGSYVSNYNYDKNNGSSNDNSSSRGLSNSNSNTKDDNIYEENIEKTVTDKINVLKEFQENINSIYGMIFKELECLFYQVI